MSSGAESFIFSKISVDVWWWEESAAKCLVDTLQYARNICTVLSSIDMQRTGILQVTSHGIQVCKSFIKFVLQTDLTWVTWQQESSSDCWSRLLTASPTLLLTLIGTDYFIVFPFTTCLYDNNPTYFFQIRFKVVVVVWGQGANYIVFIGVSIVSRRYLQAVRTGLQLI